MIAIAGDGIAAGILHRVLGDTHHVVFRRPRRHKHRCHIRPCGWGIAGAGINLIETLGITPPCIRWDGSIFFAGREVSANLWSIDKPELIRRLLNGADIMTGNPHDLNPDTVVDATGLARAYIGPADNDHTAVNFQMRVRFLRPFHLVPRFNPIHGGYMWEIPLGDNEVHIGLGSVTLDEVMLRQMFSDMMKRMDGKIICTCREPVRLSGIAWPLVRDNIVAVGEAAGTVVPLGGAGIVPSIESAILVGNILKEGGTLRDCADGLKYAFLRFDRQRKALDRMISRSGVHPLDWWTLYRAIRYMGISPGLRDMLHILKAINRGLREGHWCATI